MAYSVKPIIVVSKCLGFENCRYNGGIENNCFVQKLKKYVDFITVCPEADSGMPTPRETIRLVENGENIDVLQPSTGSLYTKQMSDFTIAFLNNLSAVDGFIFKNKSPSCGTKDAKIYSDNSKGASSKRGSGIFSSKAYELFPNVIIEDEGRLSNFKIREHFLTRIFIMCDFRSIKAKNSIKELKSFHIKNNLLFLAYNQKYSKLLDSLVYDKYDNENISIEQLLTDYEGYLLQLLDKAPRYTSNINVLIKTIRSFKEMISEDEIEFIRNTINKYKKGYVPFSVPLYIVKGYIIRFHLCNLIEQSFFMPYPEDLIEVNDSGKMIH